MLNWIARYDHVVCFSAYKDVNCGEVIIHCVSCFFISTHRTYPAIIVVARRVLGFIQVSNNLLMFQLDMQTANGSLHETWMSIVSTELGHKFLNLERLNPFMNKLLNSSGRFPSLNPRYNMELDYIKILGKWRPLVMNFFAAFHYTIEAVSNY